MKTLSVAGDVLARALTARAFSAVTAEVGNSQGPLWTYAAGQLAFDDDTAVTASTIFDLASLTKVLATTTIALQLTRANRLRIDEPVCGLVPEWSNADRLTVTIRDLLEHCSGLPAHREYFRAHVGIEAYVRAIASEPLEYPRRSTSVYSDLGFIVLGAALERRGGASLDCQFNAWRDQAGISLPLAYLPPSEWKVRTAVTEYDAWRGCVLRGEVHDQNAAALGGVAAHAGLFGTAAAVGAAARWWLAELHASDAQQFAQRTAVPHSSRALGWDTMLPTSSCGSSMSPAAIGHTGFTGTSLWIDPPRDRYFVLLTNRIHASQTNDVIQLVRREFHDAANADLS